MQLTPTISGTGPLEPVRGRVPVASCEIGATVFTPSTAIWPGADVVGGDAVPPTIPTTAGAVVVVAVFPCGVTGAIVVVAGASVVVVSGTTTMGATVVGAPVISGVVVVGATVPGVTDTGTTVVVVVEVVVVVSAPIVVVVVESVHVVVGVVQGVPA